MKMSVNALTAVLTIDVRHGDSYFDEVGMVRVFASGVAQLGGEGLGPDCADNTRLTHSCNHTEKKKRKTSNNQTLCFHEKSSTENSFICQFSVRAQNCGGRERNTAGSCLSC